jgi:predicted AAA+ superfamily ATPase
MQIKRILEQRVVAHIARPEITLIVGPRQVGKTTLITQIADQLKLQNKKVLTLNLDIEDDFALFATQSQVINRLKLEFGSEKGYVFIDEVQRKEDAGRFFKGIYDMKLPYKFVLTGSGSVELKEKISESLAGRKQLFEMLPVSFLEFLDYKTNYTYSDRLQQFITANDPRLGYLLEEYLQFGGYPRVITSDTLERKRSEMQEIYTSYLEKDIIQLLKIQKSESFTKLLTLLASQLGNGVNVAELSTTIGIDSDTVKNYLWYLQKTYIVQVCTPFYTNTRSELTKMPVVYFRDLGMRNYAQNRFRHFDMNVEGGHLFENFVLNHLEDTFRDLDPTINYWRTKDGAEVDFIFKVGATVIPIEVKYQKLTKPNPGRAMHNFISKYSPKHALIVNLELNKRLIIANTEVLFKSFSQFLIQDMIKL